MTSFTHEGDTRRVFRKGEGQCVLVMTELPGITPKVLGFCEHLVEAGFAVAVPQFIGTPGKELSAGYITRSLGRVCVSRQFSAFVTGRTSPLVYWMRALARRLHEEHGGPGVGVVGMCLTGNFALAAMAEPAVIAPVAAQPSLPFGVSAEHRRDLGVSDRDLAVIKERAAEGVQLMALRFSNDPLCPASRFETIRKELGDAAIVVELDSSWGNEAGISMVAHSVLGKDRDDTPGHPTQQALHKVIAHLQERLQTPPQ